MWTFQYLIKAIYAGFVAFAGPIVTALLGDDALGFGDLSTGLWASAILLGVIAFGGVLGLQSAPASIATSTKP